MVAAEHRCSGIGECWAGFCKCPEGRWGLDCSRSKAYAPDPAIPFEAAGMAYSRCSLGGSEDSPSLTLPILIETLPLAFSCLLRPLLLHLLSRSRLRIYRYELPWDVAFPLEINDAWGTYDEMYSAFEHFYVAFAKDWEVRGPSLAVGSPGSCDFALMVMVL